MSIQNSKNKNPKQQLSVKRNKARLEKHGEDCLRTRVVS